MKRLIILFYFVPFMLLAAEGNLDLLPDGVQVTAEWHTQFNLRLNEISTGKMISRQARELVRASLQGMLMPENPDQAAQLMLQAFLDTELALRKGMLPNQLKLEVKYCWQQNIQNLGNLRLGAKLKIQGPFEASPGAGKSHPLTGKNSITSGPMGKK